MVSLINDPSHFTYYLVMPMLHVSFYAVVMTFEAYLTKMYPKEIRGMMSSCQGVFVVFGSLFYLLLCNLLNSYDPKYPFIGVAVFDIIITIVIVILASVGLFGVPIVISSEDLEKMEDRELS